MLLKPKNVGIITAFLGNLRAGTWTYTINLIKHLQDRAFITAIDRENRLMPELEAVVIKDYRGGGNLLGKVVWPNFILSEKAKHEGYDLIHCTTPYGTFTKTKYKKIITICDVTPLIFPQTHGKMNVWHHRFVLPYILKQADQIITISEASKSDIVSYYNIPKEKISVTLLAADTKFCIKPFGTPSSVLSDIPRPYILNVGTLEPRKNLVGLLKAFSVASRKGVSHKLVITGAKGWGKSPLAQVVKELALEQSVIFTGFVEDADLPHLYANADFFVYPSLYEGFGLPVLEAMACGCPVITSNISSLPEVAGDAALLVDPKSEEELSTAILKLAGSSSLSNRLRDLGIKQAAQFSWSKTANETLAIYEKVLQK